MIKNFINFIICKINNHKWIEAGSCPVTGKSYNFCTKCEKMVAYEK